MKTYSAFLQRVTPNAGPRANFTITVQAVSSEMARVTRLHEHGPLGASQLGSHC